MKSYEIAGNTYFDADEAQAKIEQLKAHYLSALNLMGAAVIDRGQAVQMLIDMVDFFEKTPIDCGGLKNAMTGCDLLRNAKEVIKKADAALAHDAEFERIQTGHRRYETLRRLNPRQFADLYAESIKSGVAFDDLVDGLKIGTREQQPNDPPQCLYDQHGGDIEDELALS